MIVIFSIFGSIIAEGMGLVWGQTLNIMGMAWLVNSGLLDVPVPVHAHFPPVWGGWLTDDELSGAQRFAMCNR